MERNGFGQVLRADNDIFSVLIASVYIERDHLMRRMRRNGTGRKGYLEGGWEHRTFDDKRRARDSSDPTRVFKPKNMKSSVYVTRSTVKSRFGL